MAKIIGDDEPFDIYEPDSGIHVQELIHEFLRKKISSHADINRFFGEKKVTVFMWTQKFNSLKRMTFDKSDLFLNPIYQFVFKYFLSFMIISIFGRL